MRRLASMRESRKKGRDRKMKMIRKRRRRAKRNSG